MGRARKVAAPPPPLRMPPKRVRPRAAALDVEVVEPERLPAVRDPHAPPPAVRQGPPIISGAGQRILADWLGGKSPDTQTSYFASARHFARWLVDEGFATGQGHPWDVIVRGLACDEDEGNDRIRSWIAAQLRTPGRDGRVNKGSIATRCSGVKKLCEVLKGVRMLAYLPMFVTRPRMQRRSPDAARKRYKGVPEAFDAVVRGLAQLAGRPDAGVADVRDWAMVRLLSELGLRRIELVRLSLPDLDLRERRVEILGKGRDEKLSMRLSRAIVVVLRRWLTAREPIAKDDAVFISLGRGFGTRIRQRGTLNRMLYERARQFGVKLTPHDLRRIFCTEALRRFAPARAIEATRHASPDTLMLYDLEQGKETDAMVETVSDAVAQRGAATSRSRVRTPPQKSTRGARARVRHGRAVHGIEESPARKARKT